MTLESVQEEKYFIWVADLSSAVENTFKKDKTINIRLSCHNLEGIQRKAAREGLSYQAMISGLIHKNVKGDLVDRNTV
jgi:predicted DNA binding CopG/RHH family protein